MKKILNISKTWSPDSWKDFPIKQAPDWNDEALKENLDKLSSFPPLVPVHEIENLKNEFCQVADKKAFILIAGDCAETFSDFNQNLIEKKLQIIFQMSLILGYSIKKPIIKIGRLAGQFAKPRSSKNEKKGKICLPSYMGDAVNGKEFNYQSRIPQPNRLVKAYYHSATTLNLLRSLTEKNIYEMIEKGETHNFDTKLFNKEKDLSVIEKAIRLSQLISKKAEYRHIFSKDFFTAHEALLLDYEQALTKKENDKWYDCSSHLVWLGYRTGQPDYAHVEFLSGIKNPIGIKVGEKTNPVDLVSIINKLNPNNDKGKILLIIRYGIKKINSELYNLINEIKVNNFNVLWICDPMHGNTYKTKDGYKTRNFEDIKLELKTFFNILNLEDIHPSGVHFELTPEDVTECMSDSYNIKQSNMHENYQTACDPRLNKDQSLDIAFSINELLEE
tara:strand:+ start:7829 stop:9166 length:1338 start_codon:yes stop_codon:yes gene_type:complete